MPSSRLLWAVPVLAAILAVVALGAPATDARHRVTLRLDGVPFRPELALTQWQRSRGLMNRKRAPADGMLFVFPNDSTGAFWMKNTLVPLTIVFFNANGKRVRKLRMTPCTRNPCRLYSPGRRYRFALELRASDRRSTRQLGPRAELRRLVARAR